MNRFAIFAVAFSAYLSLSAGYATATEPVEAAIADWIAAIDTAPGWSAEFDDLAYDKTSDTAVLSGLAIRNADADATIEFEPISITGYSEESDGTFAAQTIATDGATVQANNKRFEATISDLKLDGLGNLIRDFDRISVWDPQKPFTSLIKIYSRFVDIRLVHGELGALSMTAEDRGNQVVIAYEDLAVDGWADGKIASFTTGPITMASAGSAEPFSMTVARAEGRDLDFAAMLRLYDPDEYIGGVGDRIWRTAAGSVGYHDIVFESANSRFTFDSTLVENFTVRQPERSIAALLDRTMLDPENTEELTPEELRDIFAFVSSFAVGSVSIRGVDISADDGTTGHLGRMSMTDMSAERIEEFTLEDLKITPPDKGNVDIGRVSFGGLIFPPLELLIEAAEAEKAGEHFDYARLATKLAFFEAQGIDINPSNNPRFLLDKARLDLGNYVGTIPTSIALAVEGVDAPAEAIEEPKVRELWEALGYDRIRGDFAASLAWNENDETVAIDDFRLSVDDVGTLSLSALLAGLDRDALEHLDTLDESLAGLNLVRAALSLENYAILDRWIDQQAAMTGNNPAALRQQFAVMIAEITSDIGNAGFQEQLRRVLDASIMAPGSITATATPAAPIPLVALGLLAQAAPANLPDLLGLTIESTSVP